MKLLEQRRLGGLIFSYGVSERLGRNINYGINKYCPGYKFNRLVCSNDEIRYFFDEDEILQTGKELSELFYQNNRITEAYFSLFEFVRMLTQEHAAKEADKRLTAIETKELVTTFNKLMELYHQALPIGAFAEYLDFYLSKETNELLSKRAIKKEKTQEIISALAMPEIDSFSRQAEQNILTIVNKIQKKRLSGSKLFENQEIKDLINDHLAQFYWSSCNYFNFSGLGKDTIKKMILEELSKERPAEKRLKGMDSEKRKLVATKKSITETLNLDKRLLYYFRLMERTATLYDDRKKMQMHIFYSCGRILKEVAKRVKIEFDLAKYLFPHEIDAFANGQIPPQQLYERRKYTYIDFDNPEVVVFTGAKAKKAEEDLWKGSVLATKEVNGLCASQGAITAKARVITSTKNLHELKKGEILVTGSTSPEYVPSLNKAVGIITDDGGITCHAAIISRELRLPCIVGTKVATKKIRTGDVVELKAHHGRARIIESVEKTV